MPLAVMVWGVLPALSLMVRVSERRPAAVGTKVTVIVHVPRTLMGALQLFALVKSPGSLPPATMEKMLSGALPGARNL